MGHENRLYFCQRTNTLSLDGTKKWAQVIMMVEMGKYSSLHKLFIDQGKPTDYYIYDTDENTEIRKDDEGEPLLELPLEAVYHWITIESFLKEYRRLDMLKAVADYFHNNLNSWHDDIIVLHYGH